MNNKIVQYNLYIHIVSQLGAHFLAFKNDVLFAKTLHTYSTILALLGVYCSFTHVLATNASVFYLL